MDVMIVEDERIISLATSKMLEHLGHRVVARVPSAEEALLRLESIKPDFVLMDIHLEGEMDGITAGDIIRKRWRIPLAYTTAYTDPDTRLRAEATKPYAFLAKPLTVSVFAHLFASFPGVS
ncbi:MAG TPA: response regulator [Rectinemataceae bacterium]|nr:response regulator [Rectinemataceae bacterium]